MGRGRFEGGGEDECESQRGKAEWKERVRRGGSGNKRKKEGVKLGKS